MLASLAGLKDVATKFLIAVTGGSNQYFNPYCNFHDICYSTPGAEQQDCDRDLLTGLLQVCTAIFAPNAALPPIDLYLFGKNLASCDTSAVLVRSAL